MVAPGPHNTAPRHPASASHPWQATQGKTVARGRPRPVPRPPLLTAGVMFTGTVFALRPPKIGLALGIVTSVHLICLGLSACEKNENGHPAGVTRKPDVVQSTRQQGGDNQIPMFPGDSLFGSPLVVLSMPPNPRVPAGVVVGLDSVVVVRTLIDHKGRPIEFHLERGDSSLYNAAIAAVKQGVFKPKREKGVPIDSWASIPIRFTR
jgi:hypothetical protein